MSTHINGRRTALLFGILIVLLFALACAKGEKAAAPAPSAPAQTSAPVAAPAPPPAAPTPAPAPKATPVKAVDKGVEILQRYDIKGLTLWTKAVYGGETRWTGTYNPSALYNVFKVTTPGRANVLGMLIYVDSGRCSMVGRQDFSQCPGKYMEPFSMVLVPGMFERWETPDPLTYIFHVRPGMSWPAKPPMNRSDRTVTAQDIAWYLNAQKEGGLFAGTFLLTKSIEAVDSSRIKVTLRESHADFLRLLAVQTMGVLPQECYNNPACLAIDAISPGPYIVDQFELRQRVVLRKNPDFSLKGLPYVDRIVATSITDPAAAKAAFITRQIDVVLVDLVSEAEGLVKQVPDARPQAMALLLSASAWRPKLTGPLADVRVRRAMSMTMDLASMWATAKEDFGIFPLMYGRDYAEPGFFPRLADQGQYYQFNPERAKQLVTEAGYPNGFAVTILTGSTSGATYNYAIWAQAQWKKYLNATVNVKAIDSVAFSTALFERSWEGLYTHSCWTPTCWDTADESFLQLITGSPQNFQGVDDPVINDLYLKQRSEVDAAKRLKLLQEFDRYEQDQVYTFRISALTTIGMMQGTELNGASMGTCFYSGPSSSCGWLTMKGAAATK